MGQKVNPHGMRVGVTCDWDSKWFAEKDFAAKLIEDAKIRQFLKKHLFIAGISKIGIKRAGNRIKLSIYTAKPGMVIGRGGAGIEDIMRAGAKGIKVAVSGRLGGAEIARSESYREGSIPLQTLRANIDYGVTTARTTFGAIGVRVWIYKGELAPGEMVPENENVRDSKSRGNNRRDRRGGRRGDRRDRRPRNQERGDD